MKKYMIDKQLLHDLYINQKLSVAEIAKKLGTSYRVVKRNLLTHCIEYVKNRKCGVSKKKQLIDKELLYDLHINQKLSVAEIARKLGKSFHVVKSNIIAHDIKFVEHRKIVITNDVMYDLHVNQGLSLAEIARQFKCDKGTVKTKLLEHGIEFTNHIELRKINIPEHELRYLHHDRKLDLVEIAKLFDCDEGTVTKNLRKHDIDYIQHRVIEFDYDTMYNLHHGEKMSIYTIAQQLKVDSATIRKSFDKHNIEIKSFTVSTQHHKLNVFLDSHDIEYIDNDRKTISPLELDIYIPSKKLAIELNGCYWHSELHKETNYHYNKWKLCNDKGIQLIQIWEDDFNINPTRILNFVENKLGLVKERIFARKCKIVEVSSDIAKQFHNINHIQGGCTTSLNLGITYNDKLISVCSFKIIKGTHDLVRFSSSINVVGGFTKVLKYFKTNYEWSEIITFADLCISNGNLYNLSGFEVDKILSPDYKYLVNGVRKHKFGYRKKKFATDDTLIYNEHLTERELAKLNNLLRVYDAGKIRYVMVNGGN